MGGSTADTPTTPEFLRASDAERDHAVSELRDEFAEGRLSHDTFMYRMQTALDARHRGQLVGLFNDLPPRRPRLLDRVRAALKGEGRSGPDERADPNQDFPRTARIANHPSRLRAVGRGDGDRGGADRGGAGRDEGRHAYGAPPSPAVPAPFMFPPGRGVRFVIGRNRDCDLCLTDLSVSRRHAQLVRREEGWILSDLGSHNGTRLNGWLVREPVRLSAGDRLEFGSMVFIIAADPPAWPDVTPWPEAAPDPMEAPRADVPGPDVPGPDVPGPDVPGPDVAPGPDVTLGPDDTPGAAGPIG
jgi:hypothetical protein